LTAGLTDKPEVRRGSARLAWRRLLLRPHPGGELSWAAGAYHCVRGPITTGWRQSGDRFEFSAKLPPNLTASVRIPSENPSAVRDLGGNPPADIAEFPGAAGVRQAVFEVGSGAHHFTGPPLHQPHS